MSVFGDQIKNRIAKDEEEFLDSIHAMSDALDGTNIRAALKNDVSKSKTAIRDILNYYHMENGQIPADMDDINDQIDYLMQTTGLMHRVVRLQNGFTKDAIGPMIARRVDGSLVALIPNSYSGYWYYDDSGNKKRITRKDEKNFENEAMCFYPALPEKKMSSWDFVLYMTKILNATDYLMFLAASFIASVVGLLIPYLTDIVFNSEVISGNYRLLNAVGIFMLAASISKGMITGIQNLMLSRITTKLQIYSHSAIMSKIIGLKPDFFRNYTAGEIASLAGNTYRLCTKMIPNLLQAVITAIFSFVYLIQIYRMERRLFIPTLLVVIAFYLVTIVSVMIKIPAQKEQLRLDAKVSGLSYSMIKGIQKIKVAGAEKRSFAKWAKAYAEEIKHEYNPNFFVKITPVLGLAVCLFGSLGIYKAALNHGLTVGQYYSFYAAYGIIVTTLTSMSVNALVLSEIISAIKLLKPVLESDAEVTTQKMNVSNLSGNVELSHVSFKYGDNMPLVLNDISMSIREGEYVAIVGTTGCGKSTLVRLLLGFEKPIQGAIYYDGKDLDTFNLKSFRKNIGCVMQNGSLFVGSIEANVKVASTWLTEDDVWEALDIAGIKEDVEVMPMNIHTVISEGARGISGGQKQRIMIARAVANHPKILIFDEATSALDNVTQKKVSEAIDRLNCTRIVIAHRLSTIKNCGRILVMDNGRIVEDGTFDELYNQNGLFTELVKRQNINYEV